MNEWPVANGTENQRLASPAHSDSEQWFTADHPSQASASSVARHLSPVMPPITTTGNETLAETRIAMNRHANGSAQGVRTRHATPRSSFSAGANGNSGAATAWKQFGADADTLTQRWRRYSVDAASALATTLRRPSTYVDSTVAAAKFVYRLDWSLLAYFVSSVGFTISQKALLLSFFNFRWTLIALQMACATIAMVILRKIGWYSPMRLSHKNERVIKFVAILFTAEQLAAILSLQLVTVPFHLSVRALSPLLTLVLSVAVFKAKSTWRSISSFFIILLGVVLTSHSISDIHSYGSILTFVSGILSTAKSLVTTYFLQDQLGLEPLDLVARMSPLTLVHALAISVLNGEFVRMGKFLTGPDFTKAHVGHVLLNGVLNVMLVVFGILADKRTAPPALGISTQASQAVTILVATVVFGQTLSLVNFLGVALTLGGGVLFTYNDALDQQPPSTLPAGKVLPD